MTDIVDQAVLDKLSGEVGPENIPMIIEMFCTDALARADSITQAMVEGDASVLAAQCHAMKGGALSVGAAALGKMLQAAELAAKEGNVEQSVAHLNGFQPLFDETVEALKAVIA